MVNKLYSTEDHARCAKPRPAQNIDTVRCLACVADARDMWWVLDR